MAGIAVGLAAVAPSAWPQEATAHAQAAALRQAAEQQVQPLLRTLQQLVEIDAGIGMMEGNIDIAQTIGQRLRDTGMTVRELPNDRPAPEGEMLGFFPRHVLFSPAFGLSIYGHKAGTGKRRILLMAHADALHPRGMVAARHFRLDGDRAYGFGISDNLAGIGLILHAVELLHQQGITDYARLGVLINGSEWQREVNYGSVLKTIDSEYDVVLSIDPIGQGHEVVQLQATAAARLVLEVSAADGQPNRTRPGADQLVFELTHQIAKTRALNDADRGRSVEWTTLISWPFKELSHTTLQATAVVRAWGGRGLDALLAELRTAFAERLLPGTTVSIQFHGHTPSHSLPLGSERLAEHAVRLYAEMGRKLSVVSAETTLEPRSVPGERVLRGLLGGLGLPGRVLRSDGTDSVQVSPMAARLTLLAQMVADAGSGRLDH